ncbi:hypothetical protein QVD17_02656 [Tagetes erecta]|uniref:non-specific serine/threonine protein kinase n=1 Tax=Tagetes erecta TaxID=13708 RepID=A0AAD8LEC1_TARER|nr:hypothetical protein QVD17_02656 [Tagetes erecta]
MKLLRCCSPILILYVTLMILVTVRAQDDQSGYISIDCGITEGSKYTDKITGINYVSDANFIEGGVSRAILPAYNLPTLGLHLTTLRSFPQNIRNCYTLKPKQGKNNRYLIRVRFLYGDYESKGDQPQFDIYIGADLWNKVYIPDPTAQYYHEILHLASSDYINICLVNIGLGTPFISAIELRPLDITMYEPKSTSLDVFDRTSFNPNEDVRYADDKYDRIWYSVIVPGTSVIHTPNTVSPGPLNLPSKVMSTAITPTNSTDAISLTWETTITYNYIIYAHFAEVETLKSNQIREFNVYLNGNLWYKTLSPSTNITTLKSASPLTGFSSLTLEINRTLNSTLPPIINAIEIYIPKQFQLQQTEDQDAGAIWSIKATYMIKRNWQGDPCVPQAFLWDGLNCNYNDPEAAKIISLNLSSSGLSGEIASALANLTMIKSLDLSYNNLTGNVPEFLARLDNLMILTIYCKKIQASNFILCSNNNYMISIEASNDEDKSSCVEDSCRNNKHNKVIVPVVATVIPIIVLLTAFAIAWLIKRQKRKVDADMIRNDEQFIPRNQQYTFSEVQSITNNFKTVIGKGGFGTVYYGYIGDDQVAVKMLSASSVQGYKEFQAEVKLLMDVHHKNITSLIGYCNDNNHMGIIYEFMANRSLEKHLFDGSPHVLNWERRLQIACDAAEGLVYLHHGCMPPIVHRDVKSSNILLNEDFQAKLADFGLSRAFTTEDATHVSTIVAGTRGYLDPAYYTTNKLTQKTDVYGFGVVLLELITSRRAFSEDIHTINWVKSMIAEGSIENIIDHRLKGGFDINIAWKVTEIALACVDHISVKRPAMNDVAIELKNCLQAEKTRIGKPNNQSGEISFDIESMSGPTPR